MVSIVAFLITKIEIVADILAVQDMLFVTRILNSIGLSVDSSIMLYVYNKVSVEIINHWYVSGITCQVKKNSIYHVN